ncbi:MAG: sigma-54-dependent Fis family transcriptional regulator [Deltaproteobacteria bacterium HGW-Deltaproteobacteria-18]|jgi:PAS domain S-box-containing protein|nr:MAG: sigma-54-dependent Fis family transcriptional regulator [Deltaproteobacteria bacterium HGW-Deltaproteobacteria-18]
MSGRILIVDDEESIRFTLSRFLRVAGHAVVTTSSCSEALSKISGEGFDVVFVDIFLEDGTGIDILREIKARGLSCPVIMITGDPGVESVTEAIHLGAFDYIPKPVKQDALLNATRLALSYKLANDEKERYRSNLEAIFRSVREAIISVNNDSVLIEFNEAAREMCGFSQSDVGKPVGLLPQTVNRRFETILAEGLLSGKPHEEDRVECQTGNGVRKVVSARIYPLLNAQGQSTGVVMMLRDDTHVSNLEMKLKDYGQFYRLIGKSEPMQKVYALIRTLASVQTTTLITGESGTGKELVADALHAAGDVSDKPLVKVNCSALPESLLESELFGHVKGAFTGAIRDSEGRFQKASGGTIFFDEIGDLSPIVQLKLLRVLEEREFERVGSATTVKANVRLIAATNKNLREQVVKGTLREDLYYRLKVVEIKLPPLRARTEDIPLLVDHFRERFNAKFKKNIKSVSSDVFHAFLKHPWPGNVRELEHIMEHAFVLCTKGIITFDDMPLDFLKSSGVRSSHSGSRNDDASVVLEALNSTDWNKAKAARMLGIDRVTLYRKIKRYGLVRESSDTKLLRF